MGGKAFWEVFFYLLLGLISAVLGASLGVVAREVTTGAPIVPPVDTRREVHP